MSEPYHPTNNDDDNPSQSDQKSPFSEESPSKHGDKPGDEPDDIPLLPPLLPPPPLTVNKWPVMHVSAAPRSAAGFPPCSASYL